MFDTTLKRKRVIGLLLLAIMLALFLWFNRIPKLEIVQGDLRSVTGAVVECFQGFCVDSDADASLFSRWWDFSLTYLKLIALGMTFAFLVAGLTEVLPPPHAVGTFTAGGDKGKHHVVAGLGVGHAGAHLLNDARALVPQHHQHRMLAVAFHIVQVAMTHTAGCQFDQCLMLAGSFQIQLFHCQRLEFFV